MQCTQHPNNYHSWKVTQSELMVLLMMSVASNNCSSEMMRGGAKRMMWSCVGFASNPLSLSFRHTLHALMSVE